jgi:hypothetical protein
MRGVLGIQNEVLIFTPGFNYKNAMLSVLAWAVVYTAIYILLAAAKSNSKTNNRGKREI